ncbi:MAG: VOC family protein [Bacteroidetes bacterium]|nr:VOC family protein [Bacteroidota bacterium]
MGTPVVHWEINAWDGKLLQEFYSGLFGWKVDSNNPAGYGLVNTGSAIGIGGAISQKDPASTAPSVTFYIQVEDPQAFLDRAVSLGGRVVLPVTEIPGMVTFALLADPEGNAIGLVKGTEPEPEARPAAQRPTARKPTVKRKKAPKGKPKKTAGAKAKVKPKARRRTAARAKPKKRSTRKRR